jgi:hypothetical protein
MTKRYFIDFCERVASTFVEVFLATWLIVGDTQADRLWTWNNTKLTLTAAAISAAKSVLATLKGRRDSASLADVVGPPGSP